MNSNTQNQQEKLLTCDVCKQDIPESCATTIENEDYIVYLCGLDCYDEWVHKDKQKQQNNK